MHEFSSSLLFLLIAGFAIGAWTAINPFRRRNVKVAHRQGRGKQVLMWKKSAGTVSKAASE
jgi:hypothetical protein